MGYVKRADGKYECVALRLTRRTDLLDGGDEL